MSDIVTINVGGTLYTTTETTLNKYSSNLSELKHQEAPHFIDRNGENFGFILKFFRDDDINLEEMPKYQVLDILDEAKYYLIKELIIKVLI